MRTQLKLIMVVFTTLTVTSCMSTSKFAKLSEQKDGVLMLSKNVTPEAMLNACEYALSKAGLKIVNKEKKSEDHYVLFAKLGSSMQSWGQHAKIIIIRAPSNERVDARYFSMKRMSMNRTEDLNAIRNNIETYAETYITALKEGIDIKSIEKKKK